MLLFVPNPALPENPSISEFFEFDEEFHWFRVHFSFIPNMKPGNIFEAVFCIIYLILVLYAGFAMLFNRQDSQICLLFSLMCLILGFGDCFHLIPRIYSLMAGVSEKMNAAMGIGNMITAIGMTVFYLLFVEVIGLYYNRSVKVWRIVCLILFAARIVALLLPQNDWIHNTFDPTMSLIRNVPFIAIGVIVVCLLLVCTYQVDGDPLRLMWVYVTVSFGCYAPVALVHFGDYRDAILMIVKTVAYLCVVFTGYANLIPKKAKLNCRVC